MMNYLPQWGSFSLIVHIIYQILPPPTFYSIILMHHLVCQIIALMSGLMSIDKLHRTRAHLKKNKKTKTFLFFVLKKKKQFFLDMI